MSLENMPGTIILSRSSQMWKMEFLNVSVAHGSTQVCFLDAYMSSFIVVSFKVYFLKTKKFIGAKYKLINFVYRYVLLASSESIYTPTN
jgi:hypothetical protein